MKRRYQDYVGNPGITEVDDSVPGAITVWFGDKGYEYTDANSGADHVREMKLRAASSNGLGTYINQNKASLHPRRV